MSNKQKILVIVGPTASGKSGLAWELAQKYNGEIISADSRQVYRGLDIGTGKEKFPQHLIDVADPTEDFNVSNFVKLAKEKIEEIVARGNLPIIVGGTGFWIDSLVYGYELPEVKPSRELRQEMDTKTTYELLEQLQKLDPHRAKHIDGHNKRRLIRALEIALSPSGSRISPRPPFTVKGGEGGYTALWIGIKLPKEELNRRIEERLNHWFEQGLIEETKKLHDSGISWQRLESLGMEYRSVARYLQGTISEGEMFDEALRAIRQYAKRQMTWFKRNKNINWINPLNPPYIKGEGIDLEIVEFLNT